MFILIGVDLVLMDKNFSNRVMWQPIFLNITMP